jgi:hypothetical protein
MRPAQTGQGIIREGKLDAVETAGWRMSDLDDRFMNYLPVSTESQGKLCIAHMSTALRQSVWLKARPAFHRRTNGWTQASVPCPQGRGALSR